MAANVHGSHRVIVRGPIFVKILPWYSQSEIQATKKKKTLEFNRAKKAIFIFKRFMQLSISFLKKAASDREPPLEILRRKPPLYAPC